MEAPGNNFSGPMVTDSLAGMSVSRSPVQMPLSGSGPSNADDSVQRALTPTGMRNAVPQMAPQTERMMARAASEADDGDADVAWGGAQEADSGQPVILDDVPDHSGRAPSMAGALAQVAAEGGTPEWQKHGMPTPTAQQRAVMPAKFPHGSSDDALSPKPRTGQMAAAAVDAPTEHTERNERIDASSFGAGMIAAGHADNTKRNVLIGAVAVALAAVVLFLVFGGKSTPATKVEPGTTAQTAPEAPQMGKLKFIVEPKDAIVHIAGIEPHSGDGWAVEVDPGIFQVEISHDGFKSYVTQIELAAGETQSVRVVLEKGGNPAVATLVVDSNPSGMTVLLDSKEVGTTPFNREIDPGAHVIALRDGSGIKWTKEIDAIANTKFEYHPDLSAEKQRQREAAAAAAAQRVAVAPEKRVPGRTVDPTVRSTGEKIDLGTTPEKRTAPPPVSDTPGTTGGSVTTTVPTTTPDRTTTTDKTVKTTDKAPPVVTGSGSGSSGTTTTAKVTTAPPPTNTDTKATKTPAAETKPVMLKAGEVTRVSGELGNLTAKNSNGEMPTSIAAKVCIDTSGKVTSVKVLKLTGDLAATVTAKLKTFRYTPYKVKGSAVPACLFETFKFKYKDDGRKI
jgi:hypothetical protein